jgi:hypothetical protein
MQSKKKNIQLIFLLIIFIFPVIGGWFLYHCRTHIEFKTINHGKLVNPPMVLRNLNLVTNDRKWQIAYAPNRCCDKQCETVMFTLHQLRKAFGKDSQRINLAVMIPSNCKLQDRHDFKEIKCSEEQLKLLSAAFVKHGETGFKPQDKIYLIDPLDNLFMYYPSSVDPIHILTDLKRVLEVSQIG